MINVKDPQQNVMFDVFEDILSPLAYKILIKGWQGIFRHAILQLMPAGKLAEHFSPDIGAPTKELYSVAGLILIMEFNDWTIEQAVEAYMFDVGVQYALNLEPSGQSLSTRTLERYQKLFRQDDLAAEVMANVTDRLAELLELDVSRQRLDSTHVFSNMATFGRTRLMGVTIRRLFVQLKRHDRAAFDALPEDLRQRYAASQGRMFADVTDTEGRQQLRQQVAEDMHALIARFEDDADHSTRPTFQMLVQVFGQQCEVVEDKIVVRKKTGGDCIQNPSDPDATYDGHKGAGYQVQLSETTRDENDCQLVTAALPQTAATGDSDSLEPVLDDLESRDLSPETMQADTSYGSDDNCQMCAGRDTELISPVPGAKGKTNPDSLNSDDFVIHDETGQVECCPAGHAPESSHYDAATETTTAQMPSSACVGCSFASECPVRKVRGKFVVKLTDKGRRLEGRRREQQTEAFAETYRKRSGIEGTNSGIKRRTGMSRLRVRGSPAVFASILLKVTGWNILRASSSSKMRRWVSDQAKTTRFLGCPASGRSFPGASDERYWSTCALASALPAQLAGHRTHAAA